MPTFGDPEVSNPFHHARARVAVLTRHCAPDDPVLIDARRRMHEEVLVNAVTKAFGNGPPMTDELRQRVLALVPGNEAVGA